MTKLTDITNNKLWLAPLAGYTDRAYRQLCKENGADVLVSEMVSADGLVRNSQKTVQFILFERSERPFGIQIFGSAPLIIAKAAEFCLSYEPDFIDINMGCPVKKVVKRNAGSALMINPLLASEIVRTTRAAIGNSALLGVKFRSGWNNDSLNYRDFGMLMQDSGVDFLCLHARTQSQMFSGSANWEHIKDLKEHLQIPLIGNGDISTPELALKMHSTTLCDSFMIGRGSLGRPWIFKQCKQLLEDGDYRPISREELLKVVMRHIELALMYKAERRVTKELRSQLCHYTKGLVGGTDLRQRINKAENTSVIKDLIRSSEAFSL